MGSSLLAGVYHPLVCLTVALAIVLVVRQPLCRAFGPRVAYTIWGLVPLVALGALIPAPARLPSGLPVQVAILHVPQPGAGIGHGHGDPRRWVIVCRMIGAGLLAWVQWYQQRTFVRQLGMVRQDDTGAWVSEAQEIGPVVVGVFPPKIVLPVDFRHRYTLQEQALVLAHERMHLRRHDPFANFGVAVVRSLLWFHPLVHLANRAFRIDQELACDAAVLEACPHDRRRYATALLKTQIDGQELAAGAAGCCLAVQTTSSFKRRILMLRTPAPRAWRRLLGTTVIATSCLVSSGFAWTSHALPLPVRNAHLTHPMESRTMTRSRAASILTSVAAAGLLAGASASSQAQATDSSKVGTFVGNPNSKLYHMIDSLLVVKKVVIVNGFRMFATRSDSSSDSYTIVQDERMYGPAAIATYGADAANGVALLNVKWPRHVGDTKYHIIARSGAWRLRKMDRSGELMLDKDSPRAASFNVTHFPIFIVDGVRVYYTKTDISQFNKLDMKSMHTVGWVGGQEAVAKYGPDAVHGAVVMRSLKHDGIKKP
jgi:beta-lactamase regulating signal transducer with metallopeptidase domain